MGWHILFLFSFCTDFFILQLVQLTSGHNILHCFHTSVQPHSILELYSSIAWKYLSKIPFNPHHRHHFDTLKDECVRIVYESERYIDVASKYMWPLIFDASTVSGFWTCSMKLIKIELHQLKNKSAMDFTAQPNKIMWIQ